MPMKAYWKLRRGVNPDHRIPRKYVCIKCRKAVLSTNYTLPLSWFHNAQGFHCADCKDRAKGYRD
jgi:DNA-directed RNA polymerase subunit RPC12/RpoP